MSSPASPLLSLFSLLLLCSHGLSAEERHSEDMTYTVHRSPVSDATLSPCDLSVAYGYRERVEDAQVLLDSSLKHQQGICHMHAVFVAWDAPHLVHQIAVIRNIIATRPRSTMLLVKGRLGNFHDVRRLSASFVATRYVIFTDYDILWKDGLAAELLKRAQTMQPNPFIVVPFIEEVEHSPGLRPEKWQNHEAEGEKDHHPTTYLKLHDQGPGYPLKAVQYHEPPPEARMERGWGAARFDTLSDPAVAYTDLVEPHTMLINMDMMRGAGISAEQFWASRLFARSYYPVSFAASLHFGHKSQVTALTAHALYMLYTCFTTYSDVIMFNYRWSPVENAIHSQILEGALGVVFPYQRQCMFRSLYGRFEMAELVDADTLPAADDYGSHAALLLTTISATTFNTFRFVPEGPRYMEDMGVATPPDVSGMDITEAIGAVQAHLSLHPHLTVDIGTDYRLIEEQLNLTMKRALMEAFDVPPVAVSTSSAIGVSFLTACLERTRVLAVLTGLQESREQDMALLRSLRSISGMIIEDGIDGSIQLWFVLRAARRKSETKAEAVDISQTLEALKAAAERLNAAAVAGSRVRFSALDARRRSRFRLPISKLRIHRWTFAYTRSEQLISALDRLASAATQAQQRRSVIEADYHARTEDAVVPVLQKVESSEACRWTTPGAAMNVSGLTSVASLQIRWIQASLALSEGSESLVVPMAGAQVTVKCRDPLSGGHGTQTYQAKEEQLMFVPSQLSCVGSVREGKALVLHMQGMRERSEGWELQRPQAPFLSAPTVKRITTSPSENVLFSATQHFRLLQVHTMDFTSENGLRPHENNFDQVYTVFEGQLELTTPATGKGKAKSSTGAAGSSALKPSATPCGLQTTTTGSMIVFGFHAWN